MAASSEIADSLTLEEIPIKLRCASCNKLAQEAVKLPCCDQNICSDCHANKLETACPICYHEPINPHDCRPNKALRQTVKIFLKRKVIDRENARKQEMLQKAGAPNASDAVTTHENEKPAASQAIKQETPVANGIDAVIKDTDNPAPSNESQATQNTDPSGLAPETRRDIPQQSIESPGPQDTPRRASTTTVENGNNVLEKANDNERISDAQQISKTGQIGQQENKQGVNAAGLDSSAGGYPNMGFNGVGDMTQMMQMMPNGMPNGMPNPMMAGFPNMMGMPNMAMDPMAMSQGMFNNFGGMGMMNGMNMGIGFDAGQGAFGGGFNGQTQAAWNAGGQVNFNQNAFGGGSNFGANSGFGAGYNMPPHHGNFNQMHHQPQYPQSRDFPQQGYHNQGFQRGRGRGRGGYPYAGRGRGNFHQANQGYNANQTAYSQPTPQGPVRRGSPEYTPMDGEQAAEKKTDEIIRDEFAPGDAEDRAEEEASSEKVEPGKGEDAPQEEAILQDEGPTGPEEGRRDTVIDEPSQGEDVQPQPVQTLPSSDLSEPTSHDVSNQSMNATPSVMPLSPSSSLPTGPANPMHNDTPSLTSPNGRGTSHDLPSGPSAYRGGLHGRGFTRIPNGEASYAVTPRAVEKPSMPPPEPKGLGVAGAPTGPKALRQGLPNVGVKQDTGFSIVGRASAARASVDPKMKSPTYERERSRSLSLSRHQSSRHHHRSRRSSASPDDNEDERRRERRHRRSRKYEDDYEEEADYKKAKSTRTRDPSPEPSSKRTPHRSHRDRDTDRDREKESGRSRHSHRSHRDRDRSKDRKDSGRKHSRSRSPAAEEEREIKINGASRRDKENKSYRYEESGNNNNNNINNNGSSRKRHSQQDDYPENDNTAAAAAAADDRHRDSRRRKRSKYEHEEPNSRSNHERPSKGATGGGLDERIEPPRKQQPIIPTGPKQDTHALEREKRDRERQMKELQRRALAGGGAGGGGGGGGKGGRKGSETEGGGGGMRINGMGSSGRKISVRYEDEFDDLRR